MQRIANVYPVRPYILEVTLKSGAHAPVDVEAELYGEIFEPLREAEFFMQGAFAPEQGTIAWPNGADFSPEFLIEACLTSARRLEPAG